MSNKVIMPKMGESIVEGTIIEWKKNVGDFVSKDEILLEISIEDRNELLNSYNKDLERINKELVINEKKREKNITLSFDPKS